MREISREDLVRILGEAKVQKAEALSEEEFETLKLDRLSTLLKAYEIVMHKELFEARRAYLTGLDLELQTALIRHVLDTQHAGI